MLNTFRVSDLQMLSEEQAENFKIFDTSLKILNKTSRNFKLKVLKPAILRENPFLEKNFLQFNQNCLLYDSPELKNNPLLEMNPIFKNSSRINYINPH